MLDKVDVQVPDRTPPGPVLAASFEQLRKHSLPPFRPSRFYQFVCDLREHFGVDAVVHLHYRRGRPTHKVEIIDAGEKTVAEMEHIVTSLFEIDPGALRLMRVDLAADIEGVTVPWFRTHAYVNRKQFSSRIEKSREKEVEFVAMGTAHAQTLYAGKRPNLIRIYDKIAEWRIQLKKQEIAAKRFNERMEGMGLTAEQRYYGAQIPPTFEEYCRMRGFRYEDGKILTRIERQIGGGRFPDDLRTFSDLYSAHDLDPFQALRITPTGSPVLLLPPDGASARNWLAALGLQWLGEQLGSAQLARSTVLKHARGNGKRVLDSLSECMPKAHPALTTERIQESFRRSTLLQTSRPEIQAVYLSPKYAQTT